MQQEICTTIEQSQKLLEMGIDAKTSDMFWDTLFSHKPEAHVDNHYLIDEFDDEHRIPAWSLSRLLKMMPTEINMYEEDYNFDMTNSVATRDMTWIIRYINEDLSRELVVSIGKTPVEAAYKTMCWLLENMTNWKYKKD